MRTLLAWLLLTVPAHAGFDVLAYFAQPTRGPARIATWVGVDRYAVSTRPDGEGFAERFQPVGDAEPIAQDWRVRRDGDTFVIDRDDLVTPVRLVRVSDRTWRYSWAQRLDNGGTAVLRGRLTREAPGRVVNRAFIFRWGLPVGHARVVFARDDPQ